ncbi:MAG: beta family protein [Dehalococcoidia bacterium]|nr:beta family protein [Dehalococcoidia bacterium]
MGSFKHYVPILKGKEGEFSALRDLSSQTRSRTTPVVEVPPTPWDYFNDTEQRTLDDHVHRVATRLAACWGTASELCVDLELVGDGPMADGRHPVQAFLDTARRVGLMAVPVTSLGRSAEHQRAVQEAIQTDRRGVCLRFESDGFEALADMGGAITDLVRGFGVKPSDVDALLDFGAILPSQGSQIALAARSLVLTLPSCGDWRTLTFAASSFPENLTAIGPDSIASIARAEWTAWTSLIRHGGTLPRIPRFADYGVSHPAPVDVDPRIMQMSANIRYTTDTDWLIVKGRAVKRQGFEQFHDLSELVCALPEFKGGSYSWGDAYIQRCASRNEGPGNATTWRRVGTTHHLTLVAEQVANLPAP